MCFASSRFVWVGEIAIFFFKLGNGENESEGKGNEIYSYHHLSVETGKGNGVNRSQNL